MAFLTLKIRMVILVAVQFVSNSHKILSLMKYLIIGLLATCILISCTENWNEQVVEPSEASGGWAGSGTWIMTFEEFMNTPGNIYFEDNNGLKYPLKDGIFVCSDDYPNLDFESVEISNYVEYDGSITDAAGNEITIKNGEIGLVKDLDNPLQRKCYTVTYYDTDVCEYDGGKKICWIKFTFCREPWELDFHQVSVERGCEYCGQIFDSPVCLDLG